MRCPEVNSCCCCFSVRTGSSIFGIISLLLSALFAVQSAFELFLTSAISDEKDTVSPWVYGGDIAVQVIQTLAALVLLLGVLQENATLLQPWMFTTIIVLIAELTFLPTFPSRIVFLFVSSYTWDWTRFFINLVFIVDDIYGFLVVYSYYCTLSPGSHVV